MAMALKTLLEQLPIETRRYHKKPFHTCETDNSIEYKLKKTLYYSCCWSMQNLLRTTNVNSIYGKYRCNRAETTLKKYDFFNINIFKNYIQTYIKHANLIQMIIFSISNNVYPTNAIVNARRRLFGLLGSVLQNFIIDFYMCRQPSPSPPPPTSVFTV